MVWDVGIIGVGTMGSMAAWQLAKRGVSVIGFEQFGIGHDRSAAGGESRLFRTAYKEGPQYVPILKKAKVLWRQLEKESGNQLLTLNGGLTIGSPEDDVMKNVLKSVREFEIDHDIYDDQETKKHYPQHRLLPGEISVLDKEAGYVRPEYAIVSAVSVAESLGAVIKRYTTVENIDQTSQEIVVHADGQEYKVKQLLITAGPWAGKFVPQFNPFLSVRRIILSWFAPEDIKPFLPENFPIFTRRSAGFRCFGTPTLEDSMVKVGMSNYADEVEDVDHLNRTVEVDTLEENIKIVSQFFNGLYPDPVRVSAYMDAYTLDDHSMIGKVPDLENAIALCGFSGHGFKMAPVIGEIAADLLLDGETRFNIDHLSPVRFLHAAEK